MRIIKSALLASTLLSTSVVTAQADVNVVASIKPVHSLVVGVMKGVGEPDLLVDGASSPHTYALKPSQAAELEAADVVFWVGDEIETFLVKPLEAVAGSAKAVKLIDAHDLKKLKFREGGAFDDHDHDDHAEDKHDDHDHDDHAEDKHDDHDHSEHAHGEFDPHVWLDPVNAKALVHEIEETLSKIDPGNAAKYNANADALMKRLDDLIKVVSADVAPVKDKGFVVFHDAYQYFEQRFGLSAVGSVTVSPEVLPGAERIGELRGKVESLNASCVFSEPQFEPKLVVAIAEGTPAKTGVLDPLGAGLENGEALYFELIRNMAISFKECLS